MRMYVRHIPMFHGSVVKHRLISPALFVAPNLIISIAFSCVFLSPLGDSISLQLLEMDIMTP